MKLNLKPHHKFLLKKSVLKCGITAPAIGGVINYLLYKPSDTIAYLGVQIFVSTFTTAFICNYVYCKIYNEQKALKSPRMPYNLDRNFFYKFFPKDSILKQCTFLAVVTSVLISTLPALMLIMTGFGVPSTVFEWVGCKLVASIAYSSFTAYHIIAYRITYHQRNHLVKDYSEAAEELFEEAK